jgi:hypothetical protein
MAMQLWKDGAENRAESQARNSAVRHSCPGYIVIVSAGYPIEPNEHPQHMHEEDRRNIMKGWMRAGLLVIAGMLAAGCTTPVIRSEVTAFHEWPAEFRNKSYVFERSKEQENDLEYRNYENLVRGELHRLGFMEAGNGSAAQLKALVNYGMKVRDVRVSEPVVIDRYPYWYGPAWRGYYGPFYDPFWYGPPIVERRVSSFQIFTRELKTTLADAANGKKLFDVTVISEGTNGSLAAVMPYMVRSAFTDFPGPSGVPRRVELKMTDGEAPK